MTTLEVNEALKLESNPEQTRAGEAELGRWLRCARQERGVEIAEVANDLHLTPRIIEALENERYESLGGAVFVRGYLRAYGRYLALKEEVVVETFNQQYAQTEQGRSQGNERLRLYQTRPQPHARLIAMMPWLTACIGGGLLILLIVWWYGQHAAQPKGIAHFVEQALPQRDLKTVLSDSLQAAIKTAQPSNDKKTATNDKQSTESLATATAPASSTVNGTALAASTATPATPASASSQTQSQTQLKSPF